VAPALLRADLHGLAPWVRLPPCS